MYDCLTLTCNFPRQPNQNDIENVFLSSNASHVDREIESDHQTYRFDYYENQNPIKYVMCNFLSYLLNQIVIKGYSSVPSLISFNPIVYLYLKQRLSRSLINYIRVEHWPRNPILGRSTLIWSIIMHRFTSDVLYFTLAINKNFYALYNGFISSVAETLLLVLCNLVCKLRGTILW